MALTMAIMLVGGFVVGCVGAFAVLFVSSFRAAKAMAGKYMNGGSNGEELF